MQRIWTTDLAAHAGERVKLAGWLHRLRRLSNVSFLVIRDAKGLAQVVIEDIDLAGRLARLYNESVIEVEGLAVASAQAPGGVEVREAEVEVISPAAEPPPFDLFRPELKAQLPTILDHAPLALRHPPYRALFEVASATMSGFRSSLTSMGFVEVQTPKIVAAATEGGANVFPIDYFGRTAYLAQSPQLYKQIMVGVFERVFEVGPAFRAEPHDTPRHLNEFVSLDAELGFIQGPATVMQVLAQALAGMVAAVRQEAAGAVSLLGMELPEVPQPVPAIHFIEAQKLVTTETGEDVHNEPDLAPAHERLLGDWVRREYDSDFLFVTGYPMSKRPFYTHPDPSRPDYSNSFDLLFRGLELVTGGQRLHLYEDYLAAIQARDIDPAPLSGYLEAFKYGMPPHGGFAIGLERWVARLAGAANVRQTTLFPRDLQRLTP
jgi:nondiscriminating aspartyl-tRNA synthetase